MNRHPFARDRRRPQRGERWDALAEKFQQADAPREAAQEAAGEAQRTGVTDARAESQRVSGAAR